MPAFSTLTSANKCTHTILCKLQYLNINIYHYLPRLIHCDCESLLMFGMKAFLEFQYLLWLVRCCRQLVTCQLGCKMSRSLPILLVSYFVPIGSMYGIFTYIWLKFIVHVGKYIPYMDHMVLWDSSTSERRSRSSDLLPGLGCSELEHGRALLVSLWWALAVQQKHPKVIQRFKPLKMNSWNVIMEVWFR